MGDGHGRECVPELRPFIEGFRAKKGVQTKPFIEGKKF